MEVTTYGWEGKPGSWFVVEKEGKLKTGPFASKEVAKQWFKDEFDQDLIEPVLDPKGYWGDPSGNLRRMSGEQEVIATVTGECNATEWRILCSLGREEPRDSQHE